ncbi:MAG TPA: tetratricopeptide repeat protein [Chloroflexota bacterium]
MTSFVGREAQLATIARLMRGGGGQPPARLVTLTGAPGVGKTRLATEAAAELDVDDVVYVDLGGQPAGGYDQVQALIDDALMLGSPSADKRLTDRPVLLVIDNFEHVLEGATVVAEVLAQYPAMRALVTSQRPLGVYGEWELIVPPLATSESVQLFVARARARSAEFELTQSNADVVAEICRRLDGLPLAIELAAPRIRLMPPDELLRRLDDRLELLTGGPRDRAARHHSLRAAIDWSYQLLAPDEQRVLCWLSVFAGSFNLAAVEAVLGIRAAPLLDTVQGLLDNGLLRVDSQEGEARYRMLETVREYAAGQLTESGEAETARGRYVEYYIDPKSRRLTHVTHLSLADDENVRTALEGVLADTLSASRQRHDDYQEAMALDGLGGLAAARGDLDLAHARYQQSIAIFEALGDTSGTAIVQLHLGLLAALAGDHAQARQLFESASARLPAAAEVPAAAASLDAFARLVAARGHPVAAERLIEAATSLRTRPFVARQRIIELAAELALALEQPAVDSQIARLTHREREVAALLAQGLTNRQIGERLVISERTAEGHVEHLRNKLGYSTREQIAAWYLGTSAER